MEKINFVPTDEQVKQAGKIANDIYSAFWKKGGLSDIQAQASAALDTLSAKFHWFATTAAECGKGNVAVTLAVFDSLTKAGETALKAKAKADGDESPVKEILPSWPVLKSYARQGIAAGLNPAEYESAGAMRAAIPKKDKGAQAGKGKPDKAHNITLSAKLAPVMEAVAKLLATMSADQQDEAAEVLIGVIPALQNVITHKADKAERVAQPA